VRPSLAILIPLLLALLVRLVGLNHGEGVHVYHPDMSKQLRVATKVCTGQDNVVRMFKGDHRMELYPYGTSMLVGRAAWWAALVRGAPWQKHDLWPWAMVFRSFVLLTVLGSLALLLICLRPAFGSGLLSLAGVLLAVEPLHAELSHYGMNDVPMVSLLLVVWLAALAMERDRAGLSCYSLAAGFVLGLAFGIKYQALLGGVFLAVAWLLHARRLGWAWLARSVVAAAVGGLAGVWATCPMPFQETEHFFRWFPEFMQWQANITGQNFTLGQKLRNNLPGLLMGLLEHGRWLLWVPAGWTMARLLRRDTGLQERYLIGSALAFCAVLVVALTASRDLVRENDLLPRLPFLLLAAVWAAVRLRPPLARRAVAAACVAFAAASALESGQDSLALARPDTRAAALAWCNANIPAGAVLRREQYTVTPGTQVVDRVSRYLVSPEIQQIIDAGEFDYLMTSSLAHARFFDKHFHGETEAARAFYRGLPGRFEEVASFSDRELMFAHPTIKVYRKRGVSP
jgi:hypothetical protein